MEYVQFGKTGVTVSRIGFGGAPVGLKNYIHGFDPSQEHEREQAVAAVRRAHELGITFFDTAPTYGKGESEELIGEGLDGVGDSVFIATKVGLGDQEPEKSVEVSLKRLRRTSIDLLQIHGLSFTDKEAQKIMQKGGLLDKMERLRKNGVVRFLGFTTEDNNPAVYSFIRSGRFDCIQLCYNFLFQHPCEPSRPFGSLYEAENANLGIVTMRAPTSGTFQKWIRMVNPQNTFDYTPALIQFVLSNPMIDVALIGMRSPQRVEANVAICNDTRGRIDINQLHNRYS